MINEQRLIDSFVTLVETDSVSGHEGKMRDLLVAEFAKRGLTAEEDEAARILKGEAGNLLVKIPGNIDKPPLLFAAHMDTVEPGKGIKARAEAGIIRSAGDTILGGDDKAAIAAILEALDVIREVDWLYPPLEILFTVSEEQGLKGAGVFDYSRLKARMGFVLDAGGEPGAIVVKSPCQNEVEYRVYGKAAHAGINPEEGVNAIQVAAAAISKMPCGRIDDESTCNFGVISGGTARNIVADFCWVKGECRSLSREKLDDNTRQLTTIFKDEVDRLGAKAETEVKFLYPEISLDSSEGVVQLACRAIQSIGLIPRLISTGGGSDASVINGAGIKCVNLGVGMQKVHTTDEFIRIKDLVNDCRLILAIIREATYSQD